jgi:predicted transcriptional regulator
MAKKYEWTEDKIEYLIANWNKLSINKMMVFLHCSDKTIIDKASELGLPPYKSNRWTDDEIKQLQELASEHTVDEIAEIMGKSSASVDHKIQRMHLKTKTTLNIENKWNEEKDNYIRENINKISLAEMQRYLGVYYTALMARIEELGLKYISDDWTEEETNILIKEGPNHSLNDMCELIPTRTKSAISSKAHDLGIELVIQYTYLTDEQVEYLKTNWGKIPQTQLSRDLHVSLGVINRYKKELNLPNHGQLHKIDDKIIRGIKRDAKELTRNELAEKYGLTPIKVTQYARTYNIKLIDSKNTWTNEDIKRLREYNRDGLELKQISELLSKSTRTISRKLSELGLTPNYNKWLDEEVSNLVMLYNKYSKTKLDYYSFIEKITKKLGAKNVEQVERKLLSMKLYPPIKNENLTDDDFYRLLEDSKELSILELMQKYRRGGSYIYGILKRNNISLPNTHNRRWTKEEEEQLIELSKTHSITEICKILNRSRDGILIRLNRLGIKQVYEWTEDEIQILREMWETHSVKEISEIIGKTDSAIRNKAFNLGLLKERVNNTPDDGLSLAEIEEMLKVSRNTINTMWISLGLKTNIAKISDERTYQYVLMKDLLAFLYTYPNIWNASLIDEEVLNVLPDWIKEKANKDINSQREFNITRLSKEERINLQGEDTYNNSKRRLKKK